MKNTLGWVAHPSFFLASTTAIVGAHDAASSRHGWDCTTAHTTSAAAILTSWYMSDITVECLWRRWLQRSTQGRRQVEVSSVVRRILCLGLLIANRAHGHQEREAACDRWAGNTLLERPTPKPPRCLPKVERSLHFHQIRNDLRASRRLEVSLVPNESPGMLGNPVLASPRTQRWFDRRKRIHPDKRRYCLESLFAIPRQITGHNRT
jgi:hypothetical protein